MDDHATQSDSAVKDSKPSPQTPDPRPHHDYRVRLDAYAGPLDLLLYLVKRHEIDLHDIPVATLTEQYLHHLEVIKSIDVESAGEFLVMAATLVEIKSRMIIPQSLREDGDEQSDPTQDIEETTDPRYELVQQLLAYKAFKDAAYALDDRAHQWEHRFPVHVKTGQKPVEDEQPEEVTIDLEDVNVYDLCEAFGRILETVGHLGDHAVTYDDTPISMHAEDIHDRLKTDAPTGGLTLKEIFEGRSNKSEMIGLFLATLELVRQRLVVVVQDEAIKAPAPGANIRLVLVPEEERQPINDDETRDDGDGAQYEWPDAESKLRFERRERLRATLAAKAEAEARGEEFDIKAYKKQLAEQRGGEVDDLDEEELAIEADDEDYLSLADGDN
ncbi:MAG: segregation/condensation protein A [Phycisphaeraceae bacterium]|nr:segregation/condensation protein A [Phycisphaeraceae bacterium]